MKSIMSTEFSENLKKLIHEKGVTSKQLAHDLVLPYRTIREWLSSKGRIPREPNVIKKLAEYFSVSTHRLLFGEEDPRNFISEIFEKVEVHTGLYEVTVKKVKTTKEIQEKNKS